MRKARSAATRLFYVAVGKKISEARLRLEMTQEALASDISLTRTSIVNIESGKQQLLLHTLVQISRALRVEPESLLPEVSPDGNPVARTISHFISDRKGREWIEKTISSETKRS